MIIDKDLKGKNMNAFERHGIERLSASRLNSFCEHPAYCLIQVAGIYDGEWGPAAWRGIAAERAITMAAKEPETNPDALQEIAKTEYMKRWREAQDEHDEDKIEKELKHLPDYVNTGCQYYAAMDERPIEDQGRILLELADIPVPIIGYFDLLYDDKVRDVKTGASVPSAATEANKRQMSIYSTATGREPWLDYVSRSKVGSFSQSPREVEYYLRQTVLLAKSFERILSHSEDIFECCQLVFPDIDHWVWGETTTAAALDIWNMPKQGIE